jgi:hypothetical protein
VLPELWDDVNQELELKKLVCLGPILGIGNGDRLYVVAKVDEEDSKAWVIAVDMKSAVVEGVAPASTKHYSPTTLFSPCAFPSYFNNMTQGLVIVPCFSHSHENTGLLIFITLRTLCQFHNLHEFMFHSIVSCKYAW